MEIQKSPTPPPGVSLGPASIPYSLDLISDYLSTFDAPDGPFDPNGEWEHNYVIWVAVRVFKSSRHGALRIRRSIDSSKTVHLSINQALGPLDRLDKNKSRTGHTIADVTCASDKLATPSKWEMASNILDADGKPVQYTQTRVTGEVTRNSIILQRPAKKVMKKPKAFTGSWSLFDAVQRLPFDTAPIEFDMLDDMELMKYRQRLSPGPTVELTLKGRKVRLHSFEQTGDGILPYSYWLDDQHRLLIAAGGTRTFIWDPKVILPEGSL